MKPLPLNPNAMAEESLAPLFNRARTLLGQKSHFEFQTLIKAYPQIAKYQDAVGVTLLVDLMDEDPRHQSNVNMVNFLLPYSDLSVTGRFGSALSEAILHDEYQCENVTTLIMNAMTPEQLTLRNQHGWNAAMYAAAYGKDKILAKCIGLMDVKEPSQRGFTSLMWAVKEEHAACVELLLPHSDIDRTAVVEGEEVDIIQFSKQAGNEKIESLIKSFIKMKQEKQAIEQVTVNAVHPKSSVRAFKL